MAGMSALGTDSQYAQMSDCTAHESQTPSLCRRCSVSTTCHFIARILLWIWRITSSLLSYSLIYSVIAEILLLIEVYSHHDGKFFALSCGFLIIPLLLVSFAMCFGAGNFKGACTSGDLFTKCIGSIPVVNIAFMNSVYAIGLAPNGVQNKWNGPQYQQACLALFDSVLTSLMTFPLYIINLSFLLESVTSYNEISRFSIAQLAFSVLNMAWNPIKYTKHATNARYNKNHYSPLGSVMAASFLFAPLVLIEIIHFFPFCFSYYVDHIVAWNDLLNILLIFNVPKIMFILYLFFLWGICCNCSPSCIFQMFMIIAILITVPLIPFVMFFQWDDVSDAMNTNFRFGKRHMGMYLVLICYLWISYGGSCVYVIHVAGWTVLSPPVQVSILVVIGLTAFITLSFPFAYACTKRMGVSVGF